MKVYVELNGSNFIFVDDVVTVTADYPYPGWTLLKFEDSADIRPLISWLEAVRTGHGRHRGGPEWERFSYYYNGVAVAPTFSVTVGKD